MLRQGRFVFHSLQRPGPPTRSGIRLKQKMQPISQPVLADGRLIHSLVVYEPQQRKWAQLQNHCRLLLLRGRTNSVECTLCSRQLHTSVSLQRKAKEGWTSEPIKFTTSAANIKTLPDMGDRNPYQAYSVILSLTIFLVYFLYLREENDLDEGLNTHLFERVPGAEEAHLKQVIPRMRDHGVDTAEAEARLKQIIQEKKGNM